MLTSYQHILCIAENGVIAELELFLVLNQRPALAPQSTDKLRHLHDAVTLVDLIDSRIHYTERPCPTNAIATTTRHDTIQNVYQVLID